MGETTRKTGLYPDMLGRSRYLLGSTTVEVRLLQRIVVRGWEGEEASLGAPCMLRRVACCASRMMCIKFLRGQCVGEGVSIGIASIIGLVNPRG